jgi:sulfoacetaldehyde acetyltransferase
LEDSRRTEQLPIFSKITKYQGHVAKHPRLVELLARCFDMAMTERGPTQFNIPRENFYGEADYDIPKPRQVARGPGADQSLDEAADLLTKAKFPVIVSGGGVIFSNGVRECAELAEQLNAPVMNSYLHNDSFPADHPLWTGPLGYQGSKAAMKLIAQADVVIALGTRLGPFGTLPQHGLDYWPKNAKIIQIDTDHRMLGLVKQISVGIVGDAKEAAKALSYRLANRKLACSDNARSASRPFGAKRRPGRPSSILGRTSAIHGQSRSRKARPLCIRDRCCASWKRRCRRTPWCRPTSATSARCRTRICASTSRTRCSPR